MDGLKFSGGAIAGLITESLLMAVVPIVLAIVWHKKTRAALVPTIIGAAVWFVFAIILKLAPAYLLLQADNPLAKAITGNVVLTYLTAGLLAGVFEETGRYLAFRFVLKKFDARRDAISYGVGHGGFESLYIGFQTVSLAIIGILVNSGLTELITKGADEATAALLKEQLAPYANVSFWECLLGVFERLPAIVVHISLSVLVFASVKEKRLFPLFPLAIVLHTAFDFSIVLYKTELVSALALEGLLAALAAAMAFSAFKVYNLPALEKTEEPPVEEEKTDE